MKLNNILGKKNVDNFESDGYYELDSTFERIKNSYKKEKNIENYTNAIIKTAGDYTAKDLVYFVEAKLEGLYSNAEKRLLDNYYKAAWNKLSEKYGMEKLFDSTKTGYLSKLHDYFVKLSNKLSSNNYGLLARYNGKVSNDKFKGNNKYWL